MFLISFFSSDTTFECQCYNDQTTKKAQLNNYITPIFHQRNRPQPIQYLFKNIKDDQYEAEKWVLNSKDADLITFDTMANGFEHNLVVVFQSQDSQFFDINACMRSTGMLIIVQLPEIKVRHLCFGKGPCTNHVDHFLDFLPQVQFH